MCILQAIEEGTVEMLDNTDFLETDIPFDIPLPGEPFMKVHTTYTYIHSV